MAATILIMLFSIVAVAQCQLRHDSLCSKVQNLQESVCGTQVATNRGPAVQGPQGKRGVPGQKGEAGSRGAPGLVGDAGIVDYSRVEEMMSRQMHEAFMKLGSTMNPASSCEEIKRTNTSGTDGLYVLKDSEGNIFQTYCAMNTAGGGWTLVASIHENNMKGRCTTGDRWSSEQGNSAAHPHGDGFWENRATHGEATSATSDDYKNSGYFAMTARNIMIWQVTNDTPLESFTSEAFIKFHTTNGFLASYGGNLKTLYSDYFQMRSHKFKANVDNGPAIPIVWDTGSNGYFQSLLGVNVWGETDAGFVQFRAINHERSVFALCPAVKIKPGKANVEHACIGSTSHFNVRGTEMYCGDFASRDYEPSAGWSSDRKLIDSVVMIFYK